MLRGESEEPAGTGSRLVVVGVPAVLLLAVLALPGCAGLRVPPSGPAETVPTPAAPEETYPPRPEADRPDAQPPQDDAEVPRGIFHHVQPGQTLWRIARVYGVAIDEIVRVNGIDDPEEIEVGQQVFVPGVDRVLEVPPYPAPLPEVPVPAPLERAIGGDRPLDFEWPVAGGEILSRYGARRRTHRHSGIDIRGSRGEDVVAAQDGVVTFSGATRTGYGRLVIVDHGGGVESLYAHHQELLVRAGDRVTRGEPIARVGRSGNATTPHCHFEIRRGGVPVDPLPYFLQVAEVRP